MKTIIIFLLTATIAFSQTREPEQHTFYMLDSNQNPYNFILDSQNDYFKLTKFQLGWHWGSMKKLTSSLLMNQADITTHTTSNPPYHPMGNFNDSTLYYVRAYYDTIINGQRKEGYLYTHAKYDDYILFTNGINFDPSLYINPSNHFELNIRDGDPQNPVFGFLNKKGTVINDPLDENYSRFIMTDNNPSSPDSLSEPWFHQDVVLCSLNNNNLYSS